MSGPNEEACHSVHSESHGGTACNIISVSDEEFGDYLGKGKSINKTIVSFIKTILTLFR